MNSGLKYLLAGTCAVLFLSVQPSPAYASECGDLPDVEWWSKTHDDVSEIVEKKYNGNWEPYITQWRKYEVRMQRAQSRGTTVEVKSRGLKLSGKLLEEHVEDIATRIEVLECLKAEAGGGEGGDVPVPGERATPRVAAAPGVTTLPRFDRPAEVTSTSREGNDGERARASASEQVAEVTEGEFQLEVTARCEAGAAVFQVTNLGDRWPRLGAISIYRTDKDALLSKRRLRMNNSQQASFRVRKKQSSNVTEVGLWIEPTWFERSFKYDSKITCN